MPALAFDCQPTLVGCTLHLRPLAASDYAALFLAASDPDIWAGHPVTERYRPEVFAPYFAALMATQAALAIIDVATGDIVGCSSYYTPPDRPDGIAIGFTFLVRRKWGGGTNRELKTLMLDHAFTGYDTVYFHIAPANIRSQKATLKIGAAHLYDAELALSPELAWWKCYGLSRAQWKP